MSLRQAVEVVMRSAVLVAFVAAGLLIPPPAAEAAGRLKLGTADPGYVGGDHARRDRLFNKTVRADADVVRFNAFWFRIAPDPAIQLTDATDPSNPLYEFDDLDAAVEDADARGLDVILTLQRAPSWAEAPNRPSGLSTGVWSPDPVAFGRYAHALAARYSGRFAPDPSRPEATLPRVRWFQAWNEPNHRGHLMPQYQGTEAVSVEIYRRLLGEAYDGIKAGSNNRASVVVAGATPNETVTGARVGPETFWRKLLCLDGSLNRVPSCRRAKFDVFDHHPITSENPSEPAPGDGVYIADYRDLTRLLRSAEAARAVAPTKSAPRPTWATEIYWETNPPNPDGVPLRKAATYLQEGIRMLYQRGVKLQLNFFLADAATGPSNPVWRPAGLLFDDLTRKPSFTAFRFPFVSERRSRRKITVWGKSPVKGRLRVQRRRKGEWRPIRQFAVKAGEVFEANVRLASEASLRARVGGENSLIYRQK